MIALRALPRPKIVCRAMVRINRTVRLGGDISLFFHVNASPNAEGHFAMGSIILWRVREGGLALFAKENRRLIDALK